MTLLNKDQIETLNNAVDVLIEGIEWDMLDDEHQAKNAISGADNPYYNAGAFFMFGARANGAIMGYLSKKDRLDKAEEALAEEERINGPESIKADRLAQNVRKNDAAMKTAALFKALRKNSTRRSWASRSEAEPPTTRRSSSGTPTRRSPSSTHGQPPVRRHLPRIGRKPHWRGGRPAERRPDWARGGSMPPPFFAQNRGSAAFGAFQPVLTKGESERQCA